MNREIGEVMVIAIYRTRLYTQGPIHIITYDSHFNPNLCISNANWDK